MAKQYEQFKKEFTELNHKSEEIDAHFVRYDKSKNNLFGYVEAGTKELGLRIQELKDSAHTGKTLGDFASDPEVKKMIIAVNTSTVRLEDDVKHLNSLKPAGAALSKRWDALMLELTNEINARKKELTTKLGVGNKSLPDMQKLLAEVKKKFDGDGAASNLASNMRLCDTPGYWIRERDKLLNDALSKTKSLALSDLQKELMRQMLDVRNLTINVGKAKKLYDEVMAACLKIYEVAKVGDAKKLAAIKNSPTQPMSDLTALANRFEVALKDPTIVKLLRSSKDESAVRGNVNKILDMKNKAFETVKKLSGVIGKAANA